MRATRAALLSPGALDPGVCAAAGAAATARDIKAAARLFMTTPHLKSVAPFSAGKAWLSIALLSGMPSPQI
jgi:hypothetical protein